MVNGSLLGRKSAETTPKCHLADGRRTGEECNTHARQISSLLFLLHRPTLILLRTYMATRTISSFCFLLRRLLPFVSLIIFPFILFLLLFLFLVFFWRCFSFLSLNIACISAQGPETNQQLTGLSFLNLLHAVSPVLGSFGRLTR